MVACQDTVTVLLAGGFGGGLSGVQLSILNNIMHDIEK